VHQRSATAAMTDATPLPFDLPSVRRKKLTVDFDGGNQSSDAGLLLLRQAERKLGVCGRLADAMPDRRDASRIRHDMFEMVMARVSAIACGHKDAIDLDRLRHDPLMKVAVGRCPATGAPLASQSTISRLENAPSKTEAARLAAALVDQAGTTVKPGKQESLDIDDTFCAAHGAQQLAFWNAHHDERGFASMHIYQVASGTPVVAILRPARTPKGTEVRTVIKHVTKRLRRHWRNTRIGGTLASSGGATATTAGSRPWNGRKTTMQTTFLASPAIARSMPWWPRRQSICAFIMR
jgi:hypothetical protein